MKVHKTIPILRIFDVAKALEFYGEYLGFTVDWEHRFDPEAPMYMQVSRGDLVLHLSEHYGDATPGSTVYVSVRMRALHPTSLRVTPRAELRTSRATSGSSATPDSLCEPAAT